MDTAQHIGTYSGLQEDHLESVLMGVAGALVETWHMLPPLVSVTPVADSVIRLDNIPPCIAS